MVQATRHQRAFTLVEALVSVLLVAGGIVACLTTLSAMGQAQVRALETEKMQRLAVEKYREIIALGLLPNGSISGDFSSRGDTTHKWSADRIPGTLDGLDCIRVDVARKNSALNRGVEVQGLVAVTGSGS